MIIKVEFSEKKQVYTPLNFQVPTNWREVKVVVSFRFILVHIILVTLHV